MVFAGIAPVGGWICATRPEVFPCFDWSAIRQDWIILRRGLRPCRCRKHLVLLQIFQVGCEFSHALVALFRFYGQRFYQHIFQIGRPDQAEEAGQGGGSLMFKHDGHGRVGCVRFAAGYQLKQHHTRE